jgi:hypothetical protein
MADFEDFQQEDPSNVATLDSFLEDSVPNTTQTEFDSTPVSQPSSSFEQETFSMPPTTAHGEDPLR